MGLSYERGGHLGGIRKITSGGVVFMLDASRLVDIMFCLSTSSQYSFLAQNLGFTLCET